MPTPESTQPSLLTPTTVAAVHCSPRHGFSKITALAIELETGLGVIGDAHHGATVQHRYQKRWKPLAPNLRQVHLISADMLDSLSADGFAVPPGALGENITLNTAPHWGWQDLIRLPRCTELHFDGGAILRLTGLRKPCVLIDRYQAGLRAAMEGVANAAAVASALPMRTGVMAVVACGGTVVAGSSVHVQRPALPHQAMEFV